MDVPVSEINKNMTEETTGRVASTYASSRLKLGMFTVGLLTVSSAAALWFGASSHITRLISSLGLPDIMVFPAVALIYLLVMAPCDVFGGMLLPRKFRKKPHTTLLKYLKGGIIHACLITAAWVSIHLAGEAAGLLGIAIVGLTLCLVALATQDHLARLIGSQKEIKNFNIDLKPTTEQVSWIQAGDTAFSGSTVGVPGAEKILIPTSWINELGTEGIEALLRRRQSIIKKGRRNRGVMVSLVWIISSLILSAIMVGVPDGSTTSTLNLIFCSTILHFIGLLVLPTPTRNMTYTIDQDMKVTLENSAIFESWINNFSRLTDGEESRSPWIERIFHPLPSVSNRLSGKTPPFAAWNATRMMLFFSIFSGGLLSRAVHCNVGRPDLWIIAPTD